MRYQRAPRPTCSSVWSWASSSVHSHPTVCVCVHLLLGSLPIRPDHLTNSPPQYSTLTRVPSHTRRMRLALYALTRATRWCLTLHKTRHTASSLLCLCCTCSTVTCCDSTSSSEFLSPHLSPHLSLHAPEFLLPHLSPHVPCALSVLWVLAD
jgi:hypothetical protein